MAGYLGKSQGVTQVDGYNRSDADAEFLNQAEGDARYVNNTGDTISGELTFTKDTGNHITFQNADQSKFYGRIMVSDNNDAFGSGERLFFGDGNNDVVLGTSNSSGTPTNSYISLQHSGSVNIGAGGASKHLTIDTSGRMLLNGAGSISGARLVARSGGLAATNSTNESNGCITFPARIASSTNFVIAQITGVNTYTMVTASCEYINIYNWDTAGSLSHGTVHAAIRSSTGGSTSAHSFVADWYGVDATYPSFYFTGTSTLNLNLTGAGSNEGIAYITIAWRNCTMSINPST